LSGLKRLIQEIHRRSLWQVLAIYLVGAAVGYQLIEALVSGLGLPAWFPALAIVLFIVGLPIVLATALVQEGARPAERPGEATPTPEGGGAAAPEQSRRREAGAARRLFTWRNAITGGALAFGLWGVGATGWVLFYGGAGSRAMNSSSLEWVESIAVLPFADMSSEGDQEYFSDGMTEEILDGISTYNGTWLIGRVEFRPNS